jgi:ATP-dependent DNA ligase
MIAPKIKPSFIEPMLLLRSSELPDDDFWLKELKLDGYRALGIRSDRRVQLRSRNDKDFAQRYPAIAEALVKLPNETVVDGEVVALDEAQRPSFSALQNYGSSKSPLLYYVFDLLVLSGRNVMGEPLYTRRKLLEDRVLPNLKDPVRYSPELKGSMRDLITAVRSRGLEGLVAKRRDSRYEPGLRSGAWRKMRINQGQELVIAGYTPSPNNFDALILGYYEAETLMYAARTRNGFTPALRETYLRE